MLACASASFAAWPMRTPMRRIRSDCSARAASGHAAAAPPRSAMNSRRLIVVPRGQNYAPHRVTAIRLLKRGERDVNCDQMSASGLGRVKTFSWKRSELEEVATRAVFPDFDYALIAAMSG